MKIHEYQGKQLLKKFGVTVPRGIHCTTVEDAAIVPLHGEPRGKADFPGNCPFQRVDRKRRAGLNGFNSR